MYSLREAIVAAEKGGFALGHFNISDSNQLNAVVAAAEKLGQPVIIGVSEGEREFVGVREVAALVQAKRSERQPVYLNADHTYSIEGVKAAIDAGFDAVIFDGSHLPLAENIEKTRECVAYARASGRDVLVEGEIGRIGTSSKLLDTVPDDFDAELTNPDEAAQFVRESGVDLLAPAVGTMHGRLKSGVEPKIDAARIAKIREAAGVPLVLHGGSGSSDDDFVAAIKAGIAVVHINTDIRVAYRKGLEHDLASDTEEIAPYRFLSEGVEGVEQLAEKYIKLFSSLQS
ncbi:MAG TPA: class II fructose-bisphosphate aldolase [Candidatus Paceibacterota bacterium]